MILFEEILEKIPHSPSGHHCTFVRIDNNRGLKIYKTGSMRDYCFDRQKLAAEHDLGPNVYEKVDFENCFCYITEDVGEDLCIINNMSHTYSRSEEKSEKVYNKYKEEMRQIKIDLCRIGIHFYDDAIFNFAFKNGKLICIDFG